MATDHPIVHVDIAGGDPNSAAQFYRDTFGWSIDDSVPGYPMFKAEGGPGGGFVKAGAEGVGSVADGVLIYLHTADIDASLKAIESHGGTTVVPRTDMGSYGAYAVFADPSGTKLGLYQAPGS